MHNFYNFLTIIIWNKKIYNKSSLISLIGFLSNWQIFGIVEIGVHNSCIICIIYCNEIIRNYGNDWPRISKRPRIGRSKNAARWGSRTVDPRSSGYDGRLSTITSFYPGTDFPVVFGASDRAATETRRLVICAHPDMPSRST